MYFEGRKLLITGPRIWGTEDSHIGLLFLLQWQVNVVSGTETGWPSLIPLEDSLSPWWEKENKTRLLNCFQMSFLSGNPHISSPRWHVALLPSSPARVSAEPARPCEEKGSLRGSSSLFRFLFPDYSGHRPSGTSCYQKHCKQQIKEEHMWAETGVMIKWHFPQTYFVLWIIIMQNGRLPYMSCISIVRIVFSQAEQLISSGLRSVEP